VDNDFNYCIQSISPSVIIPYGVHNPDGEQLALCYNSYVRAIIYKLEGKEVLPRHRSDFIDLALDKEFGLYYIKDDWSENVGAAEWCAAYSIKQIIHKNGCIKFSMAMQGGIDIVQNKNGNIVHNPLYDDVVQALSERFLLIVKPNFKFKELERAFPLSQKSLFIYSEMSDEIIRKIKRKNFKEAGMLSDIYFNQLYGTNNDQIYLNMRICGALVGFPFFHSSGDGYGILVEPTNKGRLIDSLKDGWKVLPYGITPFGARICGKW